MIKDPKRKFSEQLYQWHLKLMQTFLVLTPREMAQYQAWQREHPHEGAHHWPQWTALIGPKPERTAGPNLVTMRRCG